ncbi:unnamed protein product [Candida verbasci]|uniref:MHD domain-containing protein n=1 Tax=Candida verbasci TaxID=1227364 RepID=A0A9W4U151_9ASCO|nr:unnamed protein product [Candida verbasci]
MIEGLYITNLNNTLVYEYINDLSTPNFKALLSKLLQLNNQNSFKIDLNSKFYLSIHNFKEFNLIIYLLCDKIQSNPLIPYVFVNKLIEVLQDYFGESLNGNKIEINNDILTLILFQMIESDQPFITDANKLKDLVNYKSLLNKILSGASQATQSITNPLELSKSKSKEINDIPWRRSNVKHTNNEMYVDIIESVNIIMKPLNNSSSQQFDSAFYSSNFKKNAQNYIINCQIYGEIIFLSRLTGVPTLSLSLNTVFPSSFFHKCINEKNGVLTFIPPDGKCTIMKYGMQLNKENYHLLKNTVDIEFTYNEEESDFEIKVVNLSQLGKIDFINIEIYCENPSDSIKLNRLTQGDFINKYDGKGEWNLKNIKNNSILPIFHGCIISKNDDQEELTSKLSKPAYLKVNYSHKGSVPSGLKVESLKIINSKGLNDNVKPYKGVKYITKSANYIIRS